MISLLIKIGNNQYLVELDQLPTELSSQLQLQPTTKLKLQVRGMEFQVELMDVIGAFQIPASPVITPITQPRAEPSAARAPEIAEGFKILAPITGVVKKILVQLKQQISRGQVVAIIEAMKMENEISSDRAGEVIQILVQPGQSVKEGQPLMILR